MFTSFCVTVPSISSIFCANVPSTVLPFVHYTSPTSVHFPDHWQDIGSNYPHAAKISHSTTNDPAQHTKYNVFTLLLWPEQISLHARQFTQKKMRRKIVIHFYDFGIAETCSHGGRHASKPLTQSLLTHHTTPHLIILNYTAWIPLHHNVRWHTPIHHANSSYSSMATIAPYHTREIAVSALHWFSLCQPPNIRLIALHSTA